MAKVTTAPVLDQSPLPTTGRWVWKEESNSLEFSSNNPNADKQDKRRRAKMDKRNDRVSSSVANRANRRGQGRGNQPKSPRAPIKQTCDHTTVTLDDIKAVALDMLPEVDESFEGMYHTEQFDNFLLHLLSYFHCFFEKMTQENKQNQAMYIEPSLSEKQAFADACAKLEVAQRYLGQAYCMVILGLGMDQQHHMSCGESRVSATKQDRSMYETLYAFCTFLAWITFRRKEFTLVEKEMGRMLRSDTFNPAIRVKNAPDESKEHKAAKRESKEDTKKDLLNPTEKKLTPAEYRRLHPRRPAIKSIINQRSPAVVSILPSPKEESVWLFRRQRPLSPNSLSKMGRENDDSDSEEEQMIESLTMDKRHFKVGILGEPLNQFTPSLTPLGAENEDEENEGEEHKQPSTDDAAAEKTSSTSERNISRQQTAVSTATTEVHSDMEEE